MELALDMRDEIAAALVAALMEDIPPFEGSEVYLRSTATNAAVIRFVLAGGQAYHIEIKRVRI